jgi:UDP-glucose 4-epimerase
MAAFVVTGGAGFIGSHVVDRLIQDGHHVAVVDDLSTGSRQNVNPSATFYQTDIRSDDLSSIFEKEKPDFVDHHAAQMDVRRSVQEPLFDADVNILGSLNLIENSLRHNVKKIVYISTGGAVYGEPDYLPVDENHPVRPLCQYGISKHTVEHYLYFYGHTYGLRYTVLRYPNVYGPRQNPFGEAGVNAIFIGKMLRGQVPTIFGDGEQLRDYVYVSDIVRANIAALERGDGHIYNIGSGIGTSVNQIYAKLQRIIGFSHAPIYAEPRTGEIQKVSLESSKAWNELGWKVQVGIDEGLTRTVEWFGEHLRDLRPAR